MRDVYESTARALIVFGPLVLCAAGVGERFYHCVGGHIEPGETPLRAVIREVQEEIGLPPGNQIIWRALTVLPALWQRGTDLVHETLHLYAATGFAPAWKQWEPLPLSSERQTQLRWASVDDLVYRRVVLQPPALLPWIIHLRGRG